MDVRYEGAASTLGAGRWTVMRRVTLPIGGTVARRRSGAHLGSGSRRIRRAPSPSPATCGRTQTTAPGGVQSLESDRDAAMLTSALIMVAVSLTVLIALREALVAQALSEGLRAT